VAGSACATVADSGDRRYGWWPFLPDITFQYALADAYTIGDAYHCSVLSATGPNRTYLWGGTINADEDYGGFVAYDGGDELGDFLPWQSYPVALQTRGLTWKIYQGTGN
jgi:phospholipase C